ncbi:MAG: response regulator transcription factor [Kiritimatiellae bacterium]|nr:response regulator transcription factor [Kiritimatiellia bacterium]
MIAVVEDDESIRSIETYALKGAGFEVSDYEDGESFLASLKDALPELVILDVMLPGSLDGIEILKTLRAHFGSIPVIIASAKGSEFDKVSGLDLGADDYLVKPFSMLEFVSRVKAVLRRAPSSGSKTLKYGEIELVSEEHLVKVEGESIELTRKEFAILELLMKSPRRVFTRENLLDQVWGMEAALETRTVDMHIASLRGKLGDASKFIQTVRGVGYKLEA